MRKSLSDSKKLIALIPLLVVGCEPSYAGNVRAYEDYSINHTYEMCRNEEDRAVRVMGAVIGGHPTHYYPQELVLKAFEFNQQKLSGYQKVLLFGNSAFQECMKDE